MAINYKKEAIVRDFRNGSWFWIQTHIWRDKRLTKADKVVYGTIASYVDDRQHSYPSIQTISNDGDLSPRQAHYSIKRLEKFGYLNVERRRGKPNFYDLLKTTSAKRAPLQPLHTTPAKKTLGTPAKKTLRTISNITRSNNNRVTHHKYSSLKDIKEIDLVEISEKYRIPLPFVKLSAEKMTNWLEAKGKRYKNYKRGLMNWVLRDAQDKIDNKKGGFVDASEL